MAHIVLTKQFNVARVNDTRDTTFIAAILAVTGKIPQELMVSASWNTLCLLAPWLAFGALIAGAMHVALPANWLRRRLVGFSGVWKAVALGVPLPLCSCGVIPTGVGLKKTGASDGAAVGFLISTPQTGVDSVLVSASFFGWPFAIFKMVLAAVTGVVGGWLAEETGAGNEPPALTDTHAQTGHWLHRLTSHAIEVIESIWIWLVVGILVSAAISVWIVPTDAFQKLGDSGLLTSLLLMLAISLPLYVCATASVPIAAALVAGGMPTSAALVFLIAGPATNIATIGAIYSQFGIRNTIVYLATIILGSIAGALLFDWALGNTMPLVSGHDHEHLTWFSVVSGVFLLTLFAWFLYKTIHRQIARRRSTPQLAGPHDPVSMHVEGMNCQNCVNRIEDALRGRADVQRVQVDLGTETVVVEGNIEPDTIRQVIQEVGFVVPLET